MLRVESDIEIEWPAGEVFGFMSEVDRLTLWLAGVLEARQITKGPVAKGTEFEHLMQFLGKRFTSRLETTEYEVDQRISFRSTSGPIDMETTVTLEATNDGTRVRQVVEGDPRGFFKVAEPILVKLVKRQLDASLGNLKDLLEPA